MRSQFSRLAGLVVTVLLLGAFVSQAQASTRTLNFVGGFTGGQLGDVTFDFTLTHDFSLDAVDETSGLTVNSFVSSVVAGDPAPLAGAYGFDYDASLDFLSFGGGDVSAQDSQQTDFFLVLDGSTGFSFLSLLIDTFASTSGTGNPNVTSLAVTEITAPVPLPAGAVLLITALGGLGFLRRRLG